MRVGVARPLAKSESTGKVDREGRTVELKEQAVAKVIEFYIPTKFSKPVKWLPAQQTGRVIEFPAPTTKSA